MEILVLSARHCCVCHKPKGLNIEVHHIIPREQGGQDTMDNAIALCFDCHADAGHYFAGHPKGAKLSPAELRKHKTAWFEIVRTHHITEPKGVFAELLLRDNQPSIFKPVFIQERTHFRDRNFLKDMFAMLGKDFMEYFEERRKEYSPLFRDRHYDAIKTYDDYIDFMNGKHVKKKDSEPDIVCQPFVFEFNQHLRQGKIHYRSNISIQFRFINYGPEVLEDYKLYLQFENVINVDAVRKQTSIFDPHNYSYNIHYVEENKLEFIPERSVLVQNDSVLLDAICFRPDHKAKFVYVHWELFARNIQQKGTVALTMKPKIIKSETERYVDDAVGKKDMLIIKPKLDIDFN